MGQPLITVYRNEDSFDVARVRQRAGELISNKFFGYGAGEVELVCATANRNFEAGAFFYEVVYTFRVVKG